MISDIRFIGTTIPLGLGARDDLFASAWDPERRHSIAEIKNLLWKNTFFTSVFVKFPELPEFNFVYNIVAVMEELSTVSRIRFPFQPVLVALGVRNPFAGRARRPTAG